MSGHDTQNYFPIIFLQIQLYTAFSICRDRAQIFLTIRANNFVIINGLYVFLLLNRSNIHCLRGYSKKSLMVGIWLIYFVLILDENIYGDTAQHRNCLEYNYLFS